LERAEDRELTDATPSARNERSAGGILKLEIARGSALECAVIEGTFVVGNASDKTQRRRRWLSALNLQKLP